MRPAWFPDWEGESVAIVASGPSTKRQDVELLCGRLNVIAIKRSVEICPWADVVYGCDAAWWQSVRGLPDFKGIKVAWAPQVSFPDVHLIKIPDIHCDHLRTDVPGELGAGGNSGFQALNLAVQFGAARILLIGFDMHGRSGPHWYGRNNWAQANNPSDENYRRWIGAFTRAGTQLKELHIAVVNASSESALVCFEKKSIDETLQAWNL